MPNEIETVCEALKCRVQVIANFRQPPRPNGGRGSERVERKSDHGSRPPFQTFTPMFPLNRGVGHVGFANDAQRRFERFAVRVTHHFEGAAMNHNWVAGRFKASNAAPCRRDGLATEL